MKKPSAKITNRRDEFNCFVKIARIEVAADRHDGTSQNVRLRVLEQSMPVVGVLGYDPVRDEVVMVNELRGGVLVAGDEPFIDNLVTGGVRKGESLIDAAKREMLEETGLELKDAFMIAEGVYPSPSGMTEKITLVVGIVDTSKAGGIHGLVHEKEDLKTVILSSDKFIGRAEKGCIKDLKSITAAFWLACHRGDLQQPLHTVTPEKPIIKRVI